MRYFINYYKFLKVKKNYIRLVKLVQLVQSICRCIYIYTYVFTKWI